MYLHSSICSSSSCSRRLSTPAPTPYRVQFALFSSLPLPLPLPIGLPFNSPQFRPSANGTWQPSCILNLNRANATRVTRVQVASAASASAFRAHSVSVCFCFNSCANSSALPPLPSTSHSHCVQPFAETRLAQRNKKKTQLGEHFVIFVAR